MDRRMVILYDNGVHPVVTINVADTLDALRFFRSEEGVDGILFRLNNGVLVLAEPGRIHPIREHPLADRL